MMVRRLAGALLAGGLLAVVCSAVSTGALAVGGGTVAPTPSVFYRPLGCRADGVGPFFNGPAKPTVALSFDDGPAPDSAAFAAMLAANHVPATFFMIGDEISPSYGPLLRRELRDGDALGDHTFTHPDLNKTADVYGQLQDTLNIIHSLTGYTPCVFRPPYGDYDQRVLTVAQRLGLATVLWDVDPSDYLQPGVQTIVERVLAQVRPGSIIISHDGGGVRAQTLAAYPIIIRILRERGYRFATVPALLGFAGVYERCQQSCGGVAVTAPLPAGSIVESG